MKSVMFPALCVCVCVCVCAFMCVSMCVCLCVFVDCSVFYNRVFLFAP